MTAVVNGQQERWTERVQVGRSRALAQRQEATLEQHLVAAAAALSALPPAPGRGKRHIRDAATLPAAVAAVLERSAVAGLLTARWERHETPVSRYVGRGRGGPQRPTRTAVRGRSVLTRVERNEPALAARRHRRGWRVQVPSAPAALLSRTEAVVHYRRGWVLERAFPLVTDLPLGLSPLCVWKEDHIKGLTRLLTLALRRLTLRETPGRRGLEQTQESLRGLYEGAPTRTTERPTGTRILQALARAQITLTHVEMGTKAWWPLTPLSPLPEQLLRYLHLPTSLYTALADNSS